MAIVKPTKTGKGSSALPANIDPKIYIDNNLVSSCFVYNQGGMDILFYLLSVVDDEELNYSFTIRNIESLCEKRFNISQILTDLVQLSCDQFEIIKRKNIVYVNLFRLVSYSNGVFNIKLTETGQPFFRRAIKKFTCMCLSHALNLRGKYSKRLYMLLCRWRSLGYLDISIEDLRATLFCTPDGLERKIQDNKMLIREVSRALKDINQLTDISVAMETNRTGRYLTNVRFNITSKEEVPAVSDKDFTDLLKYLSVYGLSPRVIQDAYGHGLRCRQAETYVRNTVRQHKKHLSQGDTDFNYTAYLASILLKEGYLSAAGELSGKNLRSPRDYQKYKCQRECFIETLKDFLNGGNTLEEARRIFATRIAEYDVKDSELFSLVAVS